MAAMRDSGSPRKKTLLRLAVIGAALLLSAGISVAADAPPPVWQMVDKTPPGPMPGEPVLGKADAPLTIIEYASLTCPHCAAFDARTLPKVRQDWIDTGKARLVFRDFPLDGLALRAAVLTHCVPPDRYFDVVDRLFREQQSWFRLEEKEALARAASLGGLGEADAEACLADTQHIEAVAVARAAAEQDYGVDSTPTFFIGKMKIGGAYPYEDPEHRDFKSALETALSQKR